jgi:RES domain-containing protein
MAGREPAVLDGTVRAGRYNRPGERSLYMSGSLEAVAAAMARYGEAPRSVLRLRVDAEALVDVRDEVACAKLGIDATGTKVDWLAAFSAGVEPPSWRASDRARSLGATGLIDRSRALPGEWHMVLFLWNASGGAKVSVEHG